MYWLKTFRNCAWANNYLLKIIAQQSAAKKNRLGKSHRNDSDKAVSVKEKNTGTAFCAFCSKNGKR